MGNWFDSSHVLNSTDRAKIFFKNFSKVGLYHFSHSRPRTCKERFFVRILLGSKEYRPSSQICNQEFLAPEQDLHVTTKESVKNCQDKLKRSEGG